MDRLKLESNEIPNERWTRPHKLNALLIGENNVSKDDSPSQSRPVAGNTHLLRDVIGKKYCAIVYYLQF